MRTIGYFIIVAVATLFAAMTVSAGPLDFIRLADADREQELRDLRTKKCAGYEAVLAEIQSRFGDRTEQAVFEAEWNYAYEVTLNVMQKAVKKGTMHPLCLAMVYDADVSETNVFVLLTPVGDFAIGYDAPINHWREGTALTRWSQVDQEGWGFDTFVIADLTNGLSAKAYEEMQEVPLANLTKKEKRA